MKYCKHCGKEIPEDSKFCPFCGTSLNDEIKSDKPSLDDYGPHDLNGNAIHAEDKPNEEKPSLSDYTNEPNSGASQPHFDNDPAYNQISDQERYSEAESERQAHTYALLSLIFGILGGLLGVIFGIIGLTKTKNKKDRIMCIVGISLAVIWMVVAVVYYVYWFPLIWGQLTSSSI
jgi:hypothetical protein